MNKSFNSTSRWARRARRLLPCLFALFAFCVSVPQMLGQAIGVGGVAQNTTMVDRATQKAVKMYDFAGQVVVLDFFAYWCGPCQASSPDVEQNVKRYYDARGGNAHGVPVKVIAVNIQSGNEPATDSFIVNAGLEYVLNDYSGATFGEFSEGYIPLFVVLNGVAGSPGRKQWQVLYLQSGYPGAVALRSVIDSVYPAPVVTPTAPSITNQPASVTISAGQTLRLEVQAAGTAPLTYQWYRNNLPVAGATASVYQVTNAPVSASGTYSVQVSNGYGSVRSANAAVVVNEVIPSQSYVAAGLPLNIPDNNRTGISSSITVPTPLDFQQVKISLHITHPNRGDLRVVLKAPTGAEVVLTDYSLDSTADFSLSNFALTTLAGVRAEGTWTLQVSDGYAVKTGKLDSWSLAVTAVVPSLPVAFGRWMSGYPGLTTEQLQPAADPDGDGIPNIMEFLLAGQSPVAPGKAPVVMVSASAPDYYEYAVTWRTGVDLTKCEVLLTEDLNNSDWQAAATRGTDILVSRPSANRVVVQTHRALPAVFLRLRATTN